MHTTAKRCLIWAGALVALGAIVFVFASDLMMWVQQLVGMNGDVGYRILNFVIQVVGNFAMPLAAALVGAAIVIQTLAPRDPAPGVNRPVD